MLFYSIFNELQSRYILGCCLLITEHSAKSAYVYLFRYRTGNSPAVAAVNQGNNNYVTTGKVDSFGDTLSDPRRFDSTGMFHWCVPQQLSSCIIVSRHACQ